MRWVSSHAHLTFVDQLVPSELRGWVYLLKQSVPDMDWGVQALDGSRSGEITLPQRRIDCLEDVSVWAYGANLLPERTKVARCRAVRFTSLEGAPQ